MPKGQLLKEPISIVTGIIIFLALAVALYFIFGAPNCDALANTTAIALRDNINLVAADDFPAYGGGDVPANPAYYKTAPITLCQEHGVFSYIDSFFGGMPEYQIYFETFPEGMFSGGAGMWMESYPWSGGAAGTLAFWGVMRGAGALWKAGKAVAMGKINNAWVMVSWMRKTATYVSKTNRNKILNTFRNPAELAKIVEQAPEELAKRIQKREGLAFVETFSRADAINTADALRSAGWLATKEGDVALTKDGKLILSATKVDVTIPVRTDTGDIIERRLLVKYDSKGNIVEAMAEPTTGAPGGWSTIKTSPADAFKDYINGLANPDEAKLLRAIYALPEDVDVSLWVRLRDFKISETAFYNKWFKNTRLTKFVNQIKTVGYNVEVTTMPPESVQAWGLTLEAAARDKELYDSIIKPTLGMKTKIKDKIMTKFHLTSPEQIQALHVAKFARDTMDEIGGVAFIPKDSGYNIYRLAIEDIRTTGNYLDPNTLATEIGEKLPDVKNYFTPSELESIVLKINEQWKIAGKTTGAEFEAAANRLYLEEIMAGLKDPKTKEKAAKELACVLGFLEQNKDTVPVPIPTQFGRLEAKRIIYLDGTAFVNPASYWYKGIAGEAMTETCGGNSICVYSHAAQLEEPFYLDEAADNYFIRDWRPLNPAWYASIQGAVMWVPANPRFYVVSPCFAIAKIWKTDDTIYVSMEKCNMGDKASNYCYADAGLINQYAAIWTGADVATIIEAVATAGATEGVKLMLKSVLKNTDPVTIAQAFIEAGISWPGWPFKECVYDTMKNAAPSCGWREATKEGACRKLVETGCGDPTTIQNLALDLDGDGKTGGAGDTLQLLCNSYGKTTAGDCKTFCGCK